MASQNKSNETEMSINSNQTNPEETSNFREEAPHIDKETIMTFVDNAEGVVDHYDLVSPTMYDPLEIPGIESGDLAHFLARPVLIKSGVWEQLSSVDDTFDPFDLLVNNLYVKPKLTNYSLFKFNLHVKVVLNGMPFHQGRLGVHWQPIPLVINHTPGSNTVLPTTTPMKNMRNSILPGTRECPISPSDNGIYTTVIPFLFPTNYFPLATYFTDPGSLPSFASQYVTMTLASIGNLEASNGEIGQDASYSVYAWFEDVTLCAPTVVAGGKKKSKKPKLPPVVEEEEEPDGIISSITSAFAKATGELTSVPVLGPYMRIGSDFLDKSTRALRIFGFSRPPIYTDPSFFRNNPISNLATTNGSETVEKLSLDPKQSVLLDPGVAGAGPADVLAIQHLTRRWTHFATGIWNVGGPTDDRIYSIGVSPWLRELDTSGTLDTIQLSSMSFPSQFFNFWSGTIEYKIIFVTSQYHRGRALISYDPLGASAGVQASNTRFTMMVDLAETNEVEFSVSWAQGVPYLEVAGSMTQLTHSPIGVIYNSRYMNGAVDIRVLNELTAPSPTNAIDVLFYARAGEDFELQMPTEVLIKDVYVQQPSEALEAKTEEPLIPASGTMPLFGEVDVNRSSMKPSIFFGEAITSLRTMMKRYSWYRTYSSIDNPPVNGIYTSYNVSQGIFPRAYRNYTLTGLNSMDAAGNGCHTHMMTYLRPAYMGWKGGVRWKAVISDFSFNATTVSANRASPNVVVANSGAKVRSTQYGTDPTSGGLLVGYSNNVERPMGWNGLIASSYDGRNTLEWEVPYYTPFKFSTTNTNFLDNPASSDTGEDILGHTFRLTGVANSDSAYFSAETYVSTAEDFSFVFYLAPPIYTLE